MTDKNLGSPGSGWMCLNNKSQRVDGGRQTHGGPGSCCCCLCGMPSQLTEQGLWLGSNPQLPAMVTSTALLAMVPSAGKLTFPPFVDSEDARDRESCDRRKQYCQHPCEQGHTLPQWDLGMRRSLASTSWGPRQEAAPSHPWTLTRGNSEITTVCCFKLLQPW